MHIKNSALANIILKQLIRSNQRKSLFGFDGTFSNEELKSITSLVLTDCDCLDDIEYLPNLKSLKILGPNLDNFDVRSIPNDITDFGPLTRIAALEELVIWYDNNIRLLDVTGLQKLRTLNLKCNRNLQEIKGIDEILSLMNVCICGCPINSMGDMQKYIESTKDTPVNILDLNLSPVILGNSKVFSFLRNKLMSNLSSIRFCEHIYFYDEMYEMSLEQAREEYKIANNILNNLNIKNLPERQKILKIYRYITANVSYNYDDLKYREENYEHYLNAPEEQKRYFLRRMAFINSSFSALKTKKSVCNGYVNMAIYLLNLCNIKAEPVICMHNETLHSALKISINGEWVYADPEKDSKENGIRYFDLTKSEMSTLYELSPREYLDELEGGHYAKHFN